MNLSEKAKKHIDSCRFCWMCRHICPVGNATGQERNNARARALCLSLVARGAESEEAVADNVYECALCGACVKECVTGWDPVMFTLEARRELALNGKLPAYVDKMLESYENFGCVYGEIKLTKELEASVGRHAAKTGTLFLLSHAAVCRDAEDAARAVKALEKSGLEFTVLAKEPSSGFDVRFLAGDVSETVETAKKCAAVLNEYDKVIFFNPDDAKLVRREYKEWDVRVTAQTLTYTEYLAGVLDKFKLYKSEIKLAPQDPFALGRELEETEPLRKITEAAGVVTEMINNRRDTFMAGHTVMAEYMPAVVDMIASRRIGDAEGVGAEAIVCCSPSEHAALKRSEGKLKVYSVSDLVLGALNS